MCFQTVSHARGLQEIINISRGADAQEGEVTKPKTTTRVGVRMFLHDRRFGSFPATLLGYVQQIFSCDFQLQPNWRSLCTA